MVALFGGGAQKNLEGCHQIVDSFSECKLEEKPLRGLFHAKVDT